jgi:hypothetical protein
MPAELPSSLRDLADLQCGVVTLAQALRTGVSKTVVKSRLRQGRWQRLHPGVYAVFSGKPGREAALWAAVLSAGPGAMLSYQSAAELDGLADASAHAIHVTIPATRRIVRQPGLIVHVSERAGAARHPALLPPRTRIEETVLDLVAAAVTLEAACGWVTRALGRRLTTQARLRDALTRRARMRWRRELTYLFAEDMAGVNSVLEYRYVRGVERPHGLPRGVRQAPALHDGRREYRDVLYEEYQLALELDGRLAHPAESRWRDIRRDNAAAADQITTLRYGWLDVTNDPCRIAAEIASLLIRRGYSGCRPCQPGCPVGLVAQRKGA